MLWSTSCGCKWVFTLSGKGKYPFIPPELTPSIDYSVTLTVEAKGLNKVKITVEGTHDRFPAYEAVADWKTSIYQFKPTDSGPTPINLNWPMPFKAEKEIEAETKCGIFL